MARARRLKPREADVHHDPMESLIILLKLIGRMAGQGKRRLKPLTKLVSRITGASLSRLIRTAAGKTMTWEHEGTLVPVRCHAASAAGVPDARKLRYPTRCGVAV